MPAFRRGKMIKRNLLTKKSKVTKRKAAAKKLEDIGMAETGMPVLDLAKKRILFTTVSKAAKLIKEGKARELNNKEWSSYLNKLIKKKKK